MLSYYNIILQILYHIGLVGGVIYVNCFRTIYKTTMHDNEAVGTSNIGIFAFISLFAIMMFLDLIYLELFYYMISLCFIIMKKTQSDQGQNEKESDPRWEGGG